MVSLIIGNKGSGKTKHLIEAVNAALAVSDGHVVCVEKGNKLTYDVNSKVRLASADEYAITGYEAYYGFLAGMCSRDSDITDLFCDGTLKIGGDDKEQLADFIAKVSTLGDATGVKFTFTVSADESELPARIFDNAEKI
ncbi:MAG: hypothetical protein MJ129_06815 [Clostridia bacterium]|nr:hypothetical protein [Clostridia bacterium]